MIELLLVILAGIIIGIFTGLLPALPVFTAPFLLYYFHSDLQLESLLIFWLAVVSGSQFFGSVAVITTKIAGEESSTIYLRDLDDIPLERKNTLLYDTALGSYIAGLFAVSVMWFATTYMNADLLPVLMSVNAQIIIYTLAIASFFFVNKSKVWTLALIVLGIIIAPRNNYALPDVWYQVQEVFQGYSFYMIILGLILLPEVLTKQGLTLLSDESYKAVKKKFKWMLTIKSSLIGAVSGLIPGPSASLGSTYAYRLFGKNKEEKIVAAETANNGAVITSALPLLLLALPINTNTMIMSNLMDIKSIDINLSILESSSVFPELSIVQLVMVVLLGVLTVYYFLSTHLIDWYIGIVKGLHHTIKPLLAIIVLALIGVDLYASEITFERYMLLLGFFYSIGLVLKRYNVNPIVLLFSIILSDKLIWLYIQAFNIHIIN